MNPEMKLRAIFDELLREVQRNEQLRDRLLRILGEGVNGKPKQEKQRASRRQPGRLDPMALYRESPDELMRQLKELTPDELKDIIAENGMDRTKLAMKWKDKERLVGLIVSAAQSRTQKGDAFLEP